MAKDGHNYHHKEEQEMSVHLQQSATKKSLVNYISYSLIYFNLVFALSHSNLKYNKYKVN